MLLGQSFQSSIPFPSKLSSFISRAFLVVVVVFIFLFLFIKTKLRPAKHLIASEMDRIVQSPFRFHRRLVAFGCTVSRLNEMDCCYQLRDREGSGLADWLTGMRRDENISEREQIKLPSIHIFGDDQSVRSGKGKTCLLSFSACLSSVQLNSVHLGRIETDWGRQIDNQ